VQLGAAGVWHTTAAGRWVGLLAVPELRLTQVKYGRTFYVYRLASERR